MIYVIAWILYGILGNYILFKSSPNEDIEIWFPLIIVVLSPIISTVIIVLVVGNFLDNITLRLENGHLVIRRKK